MPQRSDREDEERPLLSSNESNGGHDYRARSQDRDQDGEHDHDRDDSSYEIKFDDDDPENPRAWSSKAKLANVAIIALMAVVSPLASSMFTPGIAQIAEDLGASEESVIATTTGYVIMLGLGPLVLAPFSETFGRRIVYIVCFAVFSALQIPTALSPNVGVLIAVRSVSGFFGSVGLANGGGTLSDMYPSRERAGIFGWYLLGPLLGPTIGPLFGGVIVTRLGWRWVYWIIAIVSVLNTALGYFFLRETYVPVILNKKKVDKVHERRDGDSLSPDKYYFEGEDRRPLTEKLRTSMRRPLVIFIQPIVLVMSLYQAIVFGTTFSIYTNMQTIFSKMPYNFDSEQIGLLYLGPGLGFLTAVWFLVPQIDTIFNKLTERNKGKELPEFRLPLANIGSVLIPASLFWFGWTIEARTHWAIPIAATFFYGVGQVIIFNTVQNYYIDSFEKYAASAIAGGSVFRSLIGGVVPLFAPVLFQKLGYGWGVSVFAFLSVLIAPSPLLFYYFGGRLRERFPIRL